ncbi:MAG: mercury(II) reductase [Promethearchaeota archaeon]
MRYEIIIIGGGAAGFAAAMKLNELKIRSLLINDDIVGIGGTCVNVGCVPTKYLLNIARIVYDNNHPRFLGLNTSSSFDFAQIMKGKERLVAYLREQKYKKILENLEHVEYLNGKARFISPEKILIGKTTYSAKNFIIAMGSSTYIPPIQGLEDVNYLTNISALQLKKIPASILILGGGALGLEFAQLFSRFGSRVILLEALPNIISNEEPEISNLLYQYLVEEGIDIHLNCTVNEINEIGGEINAECLIRRESETLKAEKILIASGRTANINDLGLEKLNLKIGKKGEIIVDKQMWAGDNIWAAGDVTGEPILETIAAREGMIAAHNIVSELKIEMNYDVIPHAIFTDPQVGSVGLTDLEANERGFKCKCNTIPIELVPKARIMGKTKGAIKMVINRETEEILGVHILSSNASNIIHEGAMILKNKMKLDDVINTIHVFPTLSEQIKLAAQSFKRDISKMTCCAE